MEYDNDLDDIIELDTETLEEFLKRSNKEEDKEEEATSSWSHNNNS